MQEWKVATGCCLPSTEVNDQAYLHTESALEFIWGCPEINQPITHNWVNPTQQPFLQQWNLSFHEAYPGTHLQIELKEYYKEMHPIRNLKWFGSYVRRLAR